MHPRVQYIAMQPVYWLENEIKNYMYKRKAIVPAHGATKSEQPEVWGQLLENYCEMLYPDAMYLHIYEPCADASIGLSGP